MISGVSIDIGVSLVGTRNAAVTRATPKSRNAVFVLPSDFIRAIPYNKLAQRSKFFIVLFLFFGIRYTNYQIREKSVPPLQEIDALPDLTDQVYENLLEAICTAQLTPETRVTQQGLAESLNVSRQPVLQALRLLRKDGFVVDAGKRGLMIAPINADVIRQTYQVRSVLDGLAAREAARKHLVLDSELIARGRQAGLTGKISSLIEADLNFHQSIYHVSGNSMIKDSAEFHWQHIRRAMGAVVAQLSDVDSIWDEHEGILQAINEGNCLLAEQLARAHGESAGEALASALSRQ